MEHELIYLMHNRQFIAVGFWASPGVEYLTFTILDPQMHTQTFFHIDTPKTPVHWFTDSLWETGHSMVLVSWFPSSAVGRKCKGKEAKTWAQHLASSPTPRTWPPESAAEQHQNHRKGNWLCHIRTSTGFARQALVSVKKKHLAEVLGRWQLVSSQHPTAENYYILRLFFIYIHGSLTKWGWCFLHFLVSSWLSFSFKIK